MSRRPPLSSSLSLPVGWYLTLAALLLALLREILLHGSLPPAPQHTHCQTEHLEHDSSKAQRFVSEDGIEHVVDSAAQSIFGEGPVILFLIHHELIKK